MNKKIAIDIRSSYGNERIYIVSSHGKQINALTGRTTINRADIENLKALGFEFEVQAKAL